MCVSVVMPEVAVVLRLCSVEPRHSTSDFLESRKSVSCVIKLANIKLIYISNCPDNVQHKAVYLLFCKFTLHVSGVDHTHHQEYTKL